MCDAPLGALVEVYHACTFFGLAEPTRLTEAAIVRSVGEAQLAEAFAFAHEHSASTMLAGCRRKLLDEFASLCKHEVWGSLPLDELELALSSDFLAASSEEEVAAAVLAWATANPDATPASTAAASSSSATGSIAARALWRHVRVPMLDQTALESRGVAAQALSAGLLSPSQLADARAFHEGPSGRRHRLLDSGDPQYTMRFSAAALPALSMQYRTRRSEENPWRYEMMACRMLGVVNGRFDFEPISSVRWEDGRLVVGAPAFFSCEADGDAAGCGAVCAADDEYPAICLEKHLTRLTHAIEAPLPSTIDTARLCALDVAAVRSLLARLVAAEEALRLAPCVQAVYSLLGEGEGGLNLWTAVLQTHIARAHGFSPPSLGVQLLRSAATLAPDVAQAAHYVRFNRCRSGTLSSGCALPDVILARLSDGGAVSLLDSLPAAGPTFLLAASFT